MVICPLLGKVLPKCSVSSSYPDPISTSAFLKDQDGLQLDRPLCLQDPFELSHNVCRNLPEKAVRRFVAFCTEAARIAQSCLSAEHRPSGGLCSLLKIEVGWKYFSVILLPASLFSQIPQMEEVNNIDSWLGQPSEERAELFSHSFKIKIPDSYLDWFKTEAPDSTECLLITCVQKLLGIP